MVNVFSFCLYGPENPRYYPGLLENIVLIRRHFPGWFVYVYVGSDVPEGFIQILETCPEVRIRRTGITGAHNMIDRFYAIDEPGVDIMMVRDADSRIHWKDRWAIREFLNNVQYEAHTIRDHREHTAKMMGGLWGIRKTANINIHHEYEQFKNNVVDHKHAYDQNFLIDRIYTAVLPKLLVHRCNNAVFFDHERVVTFPFEWSDDVYCGRIERTAFTDTIPEHESNPKKEPLSFLRQAATRIR
jgi:hypothetical protein